MNGESEQRDLEEIVEERAYQDWAIMLERVREDYKQSKSGSLFEAHINSLAGAGPAILATFLLLKFFYPENPTEEFIAMWAIITWPIFFYLSVARIWIIRRIFEKFGILLDPRYIYNWLKSKIKK